MPGLPASQYGVIMNSIVSTELDGFLPQTYILEVRLRDLASITQGIATSGKGAGARQGEWNVHVVESRDIEADALWLDGLRTIGIERNPRTEKHLLRPYDVLVTARSQSVKVALVPPQATRTVAASTLLVIRPFSPETGIAHYLWYYLTSQHGRGVVEASVALGATIPSLSAAALGEVDVPLPTPQDMHLLAGFIEASEEAYAASISAANLQRQALRDSIVAKITANHGQDEAEEVERCR